MIKLYKDNQVYETTEGSSLYKELRSKGFLGKGEEIATDESEQLIEELEKQISKLEKDNKALKKGNDELKNQLEVPQTAK